MTDWLRELRITLRGLARRPGFSLLAILTVVLGVGSATVAWGLLHQVVLRPLPYSQPQELISVRARHGGQVVGVTDPAIERLRASDVFAGVAGVVEPHLDGRLVWTDREVPELLHGIRATPGIFRTLGVSLPMGPGFTDELSAPPEAVLSHGFWQDRFGGDPSVVGRALEINDAPHTVVGVLPPSFTFPIGARPFEVWTTYHPLMGAPLGGGSAFFRAVARLAPGRTPGDVEPGVDAALDDVATALAAGTGFQEYVVRPLSDDLVGSVKRPLLFLFLGAGMVLLVAAVNLALLLAARNLERDREMRIRSALGAGRGRLVSHLLTEAGVVALVGGGLAVLLAALVLDAVLGAEPGSGVGGLVRGSTAEVGAPVILFGIGAALLPALVAATVPALRLAGSIRGLGGRGSSTTRGARRTTAILTGVEACFVFVLLVGTTLAFRSLQEILSVDPGFDTESTVALELRFPDQRTQDREAFHQFVRTLQERARAVPGVRAVGTVTNLPLTAESWSGMLVIDGRDVGDDESSVDWEVVTPGYFEAAGIRFLAGGDFDPGLTRSDPQAVIINETLARRWWPNSSPVGARLRSAGPQGPLQTVVGVVADVKQQGLEHEARGFVYVPSSQVSPWPERQLVVRSAGVEPASVVPAVRSALREVEPDLVVGQVRTLDTLVAESSSAFRLRAVLFGSFGTLALFLGMAGIYGVARHGVRSARRDIGIRMAVGADGGDVARRTLWTGVSPVLWGIGAGLALALVLGPLLEGLMFGVQATDPKILGATAAFLTAAGAGAVLPTALKARQVDPAELLREE